jgi:uncharacterized membrane protein (DUF2068 family)
LRLLCPRKLILEPGRFYAAHVARAGAQGGRLLPWIAAERAIRGALLVGAGIYLLSHTGSDLGRLANRLAGAVELDTQRPFVRHLVDRLGRLSRHQVTLFGVAAIAYGVLELVEGFGLWRRYRWAEWLTVVATSLLIPFELYELVHRPSAVKAAGIAVNVLIVIYLARLVTRRGRERRPSPPGSPEEPGAAR